jgi:phosphoribosyl-AMP cyclohydrolase / phosphoribosyl-ATP pyrophosphohydrolase
MFGKMDDVKIDFKQGLVPCIIQDSKTHVVLMLGFMNDEALNKTMKEGKVTFFSRSKNRLWTKGETSGNFLHVIDVKADCDKDTLLITVNPEGPVCHTGADTCFGETNKTFTLKSLEAIIQNRKMSPSPTSYTTRLLDSGINKIAQKVGEEAVELVIESKDENRTKFLNEAADLLFHYLVLLCAKEATLEDVVGVLRTRHEQAK